MAAHLTGIAGPKCRQMIRPSRSLLAALTLVAGLGVCSSDGEGDDDGQRETEATETTEATTEESSEASEPVDCEMGRGETTPSRSRTSSSPLTGCR